MYRRTIRFKLHLDSSAITEVNELQLTKDSSILAVITAYPETREIFTGLGMGCLDCLGAGSETLESGACMHGLDVAIVIAALNRAINAKRTGEEANQDSSRNNKQVSE